MCEVLESTASWRGLRILYSVECIVESSSWAHQRVWKRTLLLTRPSMPALKLSAILVVDKFVLTLRNTSQRLFGNGDNDIV